MTQPTEGIAVSYAATQNSHSRDQLDEALKFGKENGQYSVFILSSGVEVPVE